MGHHHHHHGHHHHTGADPRAALGVALVLNAAFLIAEAAAGFWWGSLALLSDAAHMLSDVSALALALAAAQLARRSASVSMTFGLARAEVLGAFLNGLFLLVACGWIVSEAVGRLTAGAPAVPGWPVMVVGGLGLAINLGSVFALLRADRTNLNVRGALAHMLADAIGSVGAMVAAGCLMLGWYSADAVVSMLVAALVAVGGVNLLRDAGRVLLQLPPPGLDVTAVRDALSNLDEVASVHDLHVWSLDGSHAIMTAHLVLHSEADNDTVCATALDTLAQRFQITHATLQTECGQPCAAADCGVVSRVA